MSRRSSTGSGRTARTLIRGLPWTIASFALALCLGPAVGFGNPPAPTNDSFLYASNLNAPGEPLNSAATLEDTGETIGATVQSNIFSPCGRAVCRPGPAEVTTCHGVSYGKTVWYDFYPEHNGQIEIRTAGFPNVIALYHYDPHSLLPHEIQCEPGSVYKSNELFAEVKAGVDYTYQIGGRGGAAGGFQMLFNYADRTHLAVAPFLTQASLDPVPGHPAELSLVKLRFVGVVRSERVSFACAFCTPGAFNRGVTDGNTFVLTATAPPIIGAQTRFIIGATSPAEIGRFKLYSLDAVTHAYNVITHGCLAPGVSEMSQAAARNPAVLEPVPCPTILLNPTGAEYVFWQGADHRLWEKWYSGTRWSRAIRIAGSALGSAPAVAVHANGEQDVFWRGANGDLWESWWFGQWKGPYDFRGETLGSAPSAGADDSGNEYLFWQGTDGGLWEKTYSGSGWTVPVPLVNSGRLGSSPTVAVHAGGDQDVFWRGLNGDLWEMWFNGRWNGPVDRGGGPLESPPTVATDASGNDYIFWQGPDHGLWERSLLHGRWTRPRPIHSGRLGSGPAVAVHADGEQDVFWRGLNGHVWEMWFIGGWHGPVDLRAGSASSAPSAGVSATGKQRSS